MNGDELATAINSASAALMLSDTRILREPVAAVKIGLVDDEILIDAPKSVMEKSTVSLLYAGTKDHVFMVQDKEWNNSLITHSA